MRTAIVYESMFGNTESFARIIGDTLGRLGIDATLADVRHIQPADLRGCGLLVVGAPTHAFSMSRQRTRDDAVRQGAQATRAALGVREWLGTLDKAFPSDADRPPVAVFDTRVEKVRHLPGSAARRSARVLRAQGFRVLDRPTSFYVVDLKGPMAVGETTRAQGWAVSLAELVRDHGRRDVS